MAKPPSRRNKAASAAFTDSTSAANSVNEDISQQVDPSSATITVTAVEVTELSQEEQSDRLWYFFHNPPQYLYSHEHIVSDRNSHAILVG